VSFSAQAESDTLLFKLRNRVDGYPNEVKNYEFRVEENGLTISAWFQGESYDNIWLWQTYDFTHASSAEIVSPKLPEGCTYTYSMWAYVIDSKTDFHVAFGFTGKSCIALRQLMTKEKLKILYKNVPVFDENRTKEKLYMQVDDLHHAHMQNTDALKFFENYLNTTTDKMKGTYVAFNDFQEPAKFDKCEEIEPDASAADFLEIAIQARDLRGPGRYTDVDFIKAAGEMSDRAGEFFDPTGLNKIKRCTLEKQYINPAPRNGLLKNARSIFYYSLTHDFKMLIQTNAKL
jgi:hypothetical protein